MTKLVPLQLDDGSILYVEAQDEPAEITTTPTVPPTGTEEQRRGGQKGMGNLKTAIPTNINQSMQMVQNTIRTYTVYSLNAFKNLGAVNVDEVTLEFGVNLSADAGIPYIASGKAQSNLKITVKCSYNQRSVASNGQPTPSMDLMDN